MGQVKKAYLDWCEKHNKTLNDFIGRCDEAQAMQDLEELQWQTEFEDWLHGAEDSYGGEYDR